MPRAASAIRTHFAASSPTDGLWMPSSTDHRLPACCSRLAIASRHQQTWLLTSPPASIHRPSGRMVDALEGFRCHPVMVGRGCLAIASRRPANRLLSTCLLFGCGWHPVPSGSACRWFVMVADGHWPQVPSGCRAQPAQSEPILLPARLLMGFGCHPVPASSGPRVVRT
jgi:hypothetical protein